MRGCGSCVWASIRDVSGYLPVPETWLWRRKCPLVESSPMGGLVSMIGGCWGILKCKIWEEFNMGSDWSSYRADGSTVAGDDVLRIAERA